MKIPILDKTGKKAKEIETSVFDGTIREDIIQRIAEIEKLPQEYAPSMFAGMQTSASGNVRHKRHAWKSDRGKGLSRIPKKKMSRSGDRFNWVGAVIPGTRGGRRAHPPKLGKRIGKINKKEFLIGLKSALAMVSSIKLIKKRYKRIENDEIKINFPIVIESETLKLKTKDFNDLLLKILIELKGIVFEEKKIRAGKGKMRGRKYKKRAGLLLILGEKENKKTNKIDIINASELRIGDMVGNSGARLCVFTEGAVGYLENKLFGKKK